jgi:hypothetical protein
MAHLSMGYVAGASIMKFTLTYDGELPSNGSPRKKWEIRSALHPQLAELWQVEKTLQSALRNRYIPTMAGSMVMHGHHSQDDTRVEHIPQPEGDHIDLCAPLRVGKYEFVPLTNQGQL